VAHVWVIVRTPTPDALYLDRRTQGSGTAHTVKIYL
jgi:hypothetical protein